MANVNFKVFRFMVSRLLLLDHAAHFAQNFVCMGKVSMLLKSLKYFHTALTEISSLYLNTYKYYIFTDSHMFVKYTL